MVDEPLLTVQEVAEQLRVNPETVRRWLRQGKLRGRSAPVGSRGEYRIPASRRGGRCGGPAQRKRGGLASH